MTTSSALDLIDLHPKLADIKSECLNGLLGKPKTLPSMFLYDKKGSELFDAITELPEYYPTRTEMRILQDNASDIAESVGPGALVIEIGSGSSTKTEILLEALEDPSGYIPVDISKQHLLEAADRIAEDYPDLPVQPVCADYMSEWEFPEWETPVQCRIAFFPGSTIGNMHPDESRALLKNIARILGSDGQLLIGVDLRKDPSILVPAYDDAQGVTKAFTYNLLARLNREAGTDFHPQAYDYHVRWNDQASRIEIHLVSQKDQVVTIAGVEVLIASGESIRTECSYKFTIDSFAQLASPAYRPNRVWTDPEGLFSFHDLEVV
ncbi:L-histidine N(alpha)-methyltransferase [Mucisphaera sp.]|uniref:L-histidine N(alpha)-methyltransferase n=1 Tax=Mucisphaera sp. TaxID=2913024 RepID=UPI003D10F373